MLIGTTPKSKLNTSHLPMQTYRQNNATKHKNHLETIDWTNLDNMNINEAWNEFHTTLNATISTYAPIKTVKIPSNHIKRLPWMSFGLMQSSRTLDKLYRKRIGKHKNGPHYLKFLKYRNIFNTIKRKQKQIYYSDLFHKYSYDIRKTWKVLRSIIGKSNDKSSISDQFKT